MILSAPCPAFVIQRGLSTLYSCSLTTVAQDKPYHEETISQGLLQPQRELYPTQTIFNHRSRDQPLEFRTSFYETIICEFLVQGNFKQINFHESIGTDGTRTRNLWLSFFFFFLSRRVFAFLKNIFLRNRSSSKGRCIYGKKREIGKGNLYLTENQLARNEIWCVEDNHSIYLPHKCKRIFGFELLLKGHWTSITSIFLHLIL